MKFSQIFPQCLVNSLTFQSQLSNSRTDISKFSRQGVSGINLYPTFLLLYVLLENDPC